jgi:branched-chain amino acid transport system ATP-binding protein
MLEVEKLEAGYGLSQVLFGVSLAVRPGEVVTLIGRNGMGKTTTIRTIMGLLPARGGSVVFAGSTLTGLPPFRIARQGLGLVPEGRQVFAGLTVEENLVATQANPRAVSDPWSLPRIFAMFPRLQERRGQYANTLSGGEQQMLAIGRALMTNPELLILDEATEGLAPLIREDIWRCLADLKARGQSILVVDKNIRSLARIADRHYVIEKGRIVWCGDSEGLRSNWAELESRLGV